MGKYGPTIKQIRTSKNITLKETYIGILSKSFAIDFEKGMYDIKFSKMLEILNRIMVSPEEMIFIHNKYKLSKLDNIMENINTNNLKTSCKYITKKLENINKTINHNDTKTNLKYMQLTLLKNINLKENILKKEECKKAKQYIKKYLFATESWTLEEIKIFSDMNFIFDEDRTELFILAWENMEKYKNYPNFKINLSHLLINNIYYLFIEKEYNIIKSVIKRLKEITEDITMLHWNVLTMYFEGIYLYIVNKEEKGIIKINEAKKILYLTNQFEMINMLNECFNVIKNKKQ